jgi:hypothetical protein
LLFDAKTYWICQVVVAERWRRGGGGGDKTGGRVVLIMYDKYERKFKMHFYFF